MRIRAATPNDVAKLRKLHEKYNDQFEFPEYSPMLNAFIIEDESSDENGNGNEIILAGFVELVAEAMLIVNKSKSGIMIGRALVEAQQCSIYTCATHGIRDIYAFVDDSVYAKHLIQHGFIDAPRALKLRIP